MTSLAKKQRKAMDLPLVDHNVKAFDFVLLPYLKTYRGSYFTTL